jgi:hypothetical protein
MTGNTLIFILDISYCRLGYWQTVPLEKVCVRAGASKKETELQVHMNYSKMIRYYLLVQTTIGVKAA